MDSPLDLLLKQLDETAARGSRLERERDSQAEVRAGLRRRIQEFRQAIGAAGGGAEGLKQELATLEVEDEQVAKAQHKTQHDLAREQARMEDLEREITALQSSSIV